MGLVAPLTVLPLLIRLLGGSNVEIGFVYAMATAGFLLTQPIGMLLTTHGGGKRNLLLLYQAANVLPLFAAIAALIWALGGREESQSLVRWLVIGLYSLRILLTGPIVPVWQDWMAGLFTTKSRGRAMGMWWAASCIGVSVAALAAARIRSKVAFPASYGLLFALSTVLFGLSLLVFLLVAPGQSRPGLRRPSLRELAGQFAHSLRVANYRLYLVGRILLTLGSGVTAFVAVYFRTPEGGALSEAAIIGYGAFLTLPQAVASFWLGAVGDRFGHRLGTLIGAAAQVAAIAVVLVGRGPLACVLCFVCLGVAYGAGGVSHQNMVYETCPHDNRVAHMVYETCPHDNRVAHITLSNLMLGPFVVAVPLATGYLIDRVGMAGGFAACLAPTVLGTVWMIALVRDPRDIELSAPRLRLPSWLSSRGRAQDRSLDGRRVQ
jgi:MFS family permease